MGHHLTCWEADLVFPHWLAVLQGWHSRCAKQSFSDLEVPDRDARCRQISMASALYESPTMVGDAPEDSVVWHVDFFCRPETVSGGRFDGNCVLVCGTYFDWADVFLLAKAFSIHAVCGVDGSCVRRSSVGTAGSLLLGARLREKLVVPVLVTGLQDPLAKVVLVAAPEDWSLLWATVDAELASTEWLTVAEWASPRGLRHGLAPPGAWFLRLHPPHPTVLVDRTSWTIRAGLSILPRVLSVTVPYNILCPLEEDAPPLGVSQWERVISWLTSPRRYTRLRSSQSEGRESLDGRWSNTFRVCPHDRLANSTVHSCSLCGVDGFGQGCLVCGTHVCDLCQSLSLSGWPHKRSGAQRPGQVRNTSIRGISLLRDNL